LLRALLSPDIFQVCCNTWTSSLNRRELFDHLRIAHSASGLVFQSPAAEPTRRFLHAILHGKGLRAQCSLRHMPSAEAPATAAASDTLAQQLTMQTLPDSRSLLLAAVQCAEPLWFHPSLAEQLNMGFTATAAAWHSASSSEAQHSQSEENDANDEFDAVVSAANKAATLAERPPPLQASSFSFVQCVSVALPATSRSVALPSVVIFNSSPQQPTPPIDKKRKACAVKPRRLRSPPRPSLSEEEDNAAASAAEALAEQKEAAGEGNGAGASSFSCGTRDSLPLGSLQQAPRFSSSMDRSHAARQLDDELYNPSLAPSQASTDAFDDGALQWAGREKE
jgi:hypothetical protein